MKQPQIHKAMLVFTWEDGKQEAMYQNLPEYLQDEINTYLNELEELRAEQNDDYNFVNDEMEPMPGFDSNPLDKFPTIWSKT